MKLVEQSKQQLGVVFLYDPIPLEKVGLDDLKTCFPTVTSFLPQDEVVTAESPDTKTWAQIFSARTEFVDHNEEKPFSPDELAPIKALLSALPPLQVKSFGVNLHIKGKVQGYELAGPYVTETFMRDSKHLEKKLGAPIIASAQRFTYGELARYYDIRVTPAELRGPFLHVQLHRHIQLEIAQPDRLLEQTKLALTDGIAELARVTDLL
jgi:hypothetical protein